MSITSGSTAGTFPGDPNSIWLDLDVSINPDTNTLTISGSFSYYSATVYPLSGSYSLPSPSPTLTTYVSVQISTTGALQSIISTSSMPTLQSGNILIIYSNSYPPGAASVQAISSESEPSF